MAEHHFRPGDHVRILIGPFKGRTGKITHAGVHCSLIRWGRAAQDANGWHARLPFDLESKSDSEKREWIGNAVPSESAAEIGSVIGEAILLADVGETFALSSNAIWVSPTRVALAVEQNQAALQWEARA